MEDKDVERIVTAIEKSRGGNSAAPPATSLTGEGPLATAGKTLADKMNPAASSAGIFGTAIKGAAGAVNELQAIIAPSVNTWRDLSASGASFGNSVVDMRAAAAGTRMSLDDFASVIKKNAGNFTGLGGNVAAGAQAFADLSKEMADSGATESLKAIGLTSKDANDMLALSLGNQFTVNMNDQKAKDQAIASAKELANEMDSMSKLTGKSRAEQEEVMKKAQIDAQFQAKLRADTAGMDPVKAQEYRDKMTLAYTEASLKGWGQAFKEQAIYGTTVSKDASQQAAFYQEQYQSTVKEVNALQKGDYAAASAASKERDVQAGKDLNDRNKNQLLAIGGTNEALGKMGQVAQQQVSIGAAHESARNKLMEDEKFRAMSKEAQDKAVAEEVQKGLDKSKDTSGASAQSTKAMVQLESRAKDVDSAFMNNIVKPVNKDLGPAFQKLNEGVLNAAGTMKDPTGKTMTKAQEMGAGADAGRKTANEPAKPGEKGNFTSEAAKQTGAPGESTVYGAAKMVGGLAQTGVNAINDLSGVAKHGEGGVINGPELAVIAEKGPEAVIPLDKVSGIMQEALPKSSSQGIDMSAMSKLVTTTISSAGGPAAAGGATKSSVSAEDDKQYLEQWKKNYSEQNIIMIGEESRQAKQDIEFDKQTIANKSQIIQDLKDISATRELSDEEQQELAKAEKRKARAEQHLASDEARLAVLQDIDKNGLQQQTEMVENMKLGKIAEFEAHKDITLQLLPQTKSVLGSTALDEQKAKEQLVKEQAEKFLASVTDSEKTTAGKVKDVKDMTTEELIKRDMENAQNQITKVKDVTSGDMWGDMFASIKMPDINSISASATKLKPTEEESKKKEEEAKAKKAKEEADTKEKSDQNKAKPADKSTGEVTLKEVHKSLEHLNTTMTQLLAATKETAGHAQAQVKATKSMSGNRF